MVHSVYQKIRSHLKSIPHIWQEVRWSWVSLVAQSVKNLPAMQETLVRFLHREDPLEMEMATHSSILVWKILRTEEPGRLQSVRVTGLGHNLATKPPHIELWSYDFSRFLWIPAEALLWTAARACRLVTSEPLFPSVGPGGLCQIQCGHMGCREGCL